MRTVEEARAQILSMVTVLPVESVSIYEALGRVLAHPVVSIEDMPPFSSSGMDGFAVRAVDTADASAVSPVVLQVVDEVSAGEVGHTTVYPGQAVRIMTGAPIPNGADAVVRIEDTNARDAHSNIGHRGQTITCFTSVKPGEAVRGAGREFVAGQVVLAAHTVLDAPALALAAMAGQEVVEVFKRPVVGVASTGNELVAPGEPLKPGQIRDANAPMLAALVQAAGGIARTYSIVPDSLEATKSFFAQAARECDVVLTTGGVSMGEFDFIKPALEDLGELHMWRVACKPGKPQTLGRIDRRALDARTDCCVPGEFSHIDNSGRPSHHDDGLADGIVSAHAQPSQPSSPSACVPAKDPASSCPYCLVFGLPGNPSSAYVGFELFVRPMLRALQGYTALQRPTVYARLNQPVHKTEERRYYLRGKLVAPYNHKHAQAAEPSSLGCTHDDKAYMLLDNPTEPAQITHETSAFSHPSLETSAPSTGHRIPANSFVVDVSARQTSQLISAAHHGDVLVVLADGIRTYELGDWVLCIRLDLPEEAS